MYEHTLGFMVKWFFINHRGRVSKRRIKARIHSNISQSAVRNNLSPRLIPFPNSSGETCILAKHPTKKKNSRPNPIVKKSDPPKGSLAFPERPKKMRLLTFPGSPSRFIASGIMKKKTQKMRIRHAQTSILRNIDEFAEGFSLLSLSPSSTDMSPVGPAEERGIRLIKASIVNAPIAIKQATAADPSSMTAIRVSELICFKEVQVRHTARATMRTYGKRWAKKRKQLISSP